MLNVARKIAKDEDQNHEYAVHDENENTEEKEKWMKEAQPLLIAALASTNSLVRRLSAESLGWFARFSSLEMMQNLVKTLVNITVSEEKEESTPHAVAGAVFAMSCIRKSLGAVRFKQIDINDASSLFRVARDTRQPVRIWVLHSWWMLLNHCGSDNLQHAGETLALTEAHLLAQTAPAGTTSLSSLGVAVCLARMVNSLVASLGPELANDSLTTRKCIAIGKSLARFLRTSDGHGVDASMNHFIATEWIFLQNQLAMFSPQSIVPENLVDQVKSIALAHTNGPAELSLEVFRQTVSPHVQTSAVRFLRRIAERSPQMIHKLRLHLLIIHIVDFAHSYGNPVLVREAENTLRSFLDFDMIDAEAFRKSSKNSKEMTERSFRVEVLFEKRRRLQKWFMLCKFGIEGNDGKVNERRAEDDEEENEEGSSEMEDNREKDHEEMEEEKRMMETIKMLQNATGGQLRVKTRTLLLELLVQMFAVQNDATCAAWGKGEFYQYFEKSRSAQKKKQMQLLSLDSFLVIACKAAQAEINGVGISSLRTVGMKLLRNLVQVAGNIEDLQMPNTSMLEQHVAHITATLRSCFQSNNNNVTCPEMVCEAIQCIKMLILRGITTDEIAVKRLLRLVLPSSLASQRGIDLDWNPLSKKAAMLYSRSGSGGGGSGSSPKRRPMQPLNLLYQEAVATELLLYRLDACAQLYLASMEMKSNFIGYLDCAGSFFTREISTVVLSEFEDVLPALLRYWLAASHDYAMLRCWKNPGENSGEAEETFPLLLASPAAKVSLLRGAYKNVWPRIALAASYALKEICISDLDELANGKNIEVDDAENSVFGCLENNEEKREDRSSLSVDTVPPKNERMNHASTLLSPVCGIDGKPKLSIVGKMVTLLLGTAAHAIATTNCRDVLVEQSLSIFEILLSSPFHKLHTHDSIRSIICLITERTLFAPLSASSISLRILKKIADEKDLANHLFHNSKFESSAFDNENELFDEKKDESGTSDVLNKISDPDLAMLLTESLTQFLHQLLKDRRIKLEEKKHLNIEIRNICTAIEALTSIVNMTQYDERISSLLPSSLLLTSHLLSERVIHTANETHLSVLGLLRAIVSNFKKLNSETFKICQALFLTRFETVLESFEADNNVKEITIWLDAVCIFTQEYCKDFHLRLQKCFSIAFRLRQYVKKNELEQDVYVEKIVQCLQNILSFCFERKELIVAFEYLYIVGPEIATCALNNYDAIELLFCAFQNVSTFNDQNKAFSILTLLLQISTLILASKSKSKNSIKMKESVLKNLLILGKEKKKSFANALQKIAIGAREIIMNALQNRMKKEKFNEQESSFTAAEKKKKKKSKKKKKKKKLGFDASAFQ
eukprot:g6052.t1